MTEQKQRTGPITTDNNTWFHTGAITAENFKDRLIEFSEISAALLQPTYVLHCAPLSIHPNYIMNRNNNDYKNLVSILNSDLCLL